MVPTPQKTSLLLFDLSLLIHCVGWSGVDSLILYRVEGTIQGMNQSPVFLALTFTFLISGRWMAQSVCPPPGESGQTRHSFPCSPWFWRR